ncbi:family 43 glycosylhydrolase [Sorangium cellulosum]|uniref:family 43 glycosylhydrolase n=1 Tax=Sorangium cellulosum TaxID=56 RepID=UPI003D9A38A0
MLQYSGFNQALRRKPCGLRPPAAALALLALACGSTLACGSDRPESTGSPADGTGSPAGGTGSPAGGTGATGSGGTSTSGNSGSGGGGGTVGAGGTSASGGASGSGGGSGGLGGATIFNDTFWKDTSGTPIYSQGGGVLQVGDTYYWYGVQYRGARSYVDNPVKNGDTTFEGITTYSSKDLVNWKHEATDKPAGVGGWFGRLGVAYNENTRKYVLVAQAWVGGDASSVYFATSDSPAGGFVYEHVQANPPGIANGGTGDQTIFQDDDGQAYMISSSQEGRSNRYVSPLRASDFLQVEQAIPVYRGGGREGNCMFKHEGTYYFCSSDLHGWNTSATYCVSATNIRGPWSEEFVMKNTELDYSHVTQTGFFIHVYGTEQTTIIYAGDRWADFAGNGIGFNQWVPLSFRGGEPYFHSLSAWTLNATTGRWAVAPENNWVLNPTFEADRITVSTPVGWSASNGSNSQDGHTGRWSWQLNGTASLSQSVADLPNGTYTLEVWAKSNGAGAELYIQNYGGPGKIAPIPESTSWSRVTIGDIAVSDGRAELGVKSSGQTVKVDDFTLIAASD